MNKVKVKFEFLDKSYRVNNFEYDHDALLLDKLYFELTTTDGEAVHAIQSNQDKELVVEYYTDNTVITYALMNYNVDDTAWTRESWNAPYIYTLKISSNAIRYIYSKEDNYNNYYNKYINNKSKNEGENNMKKSINSIFEEAFEQEKRREAGILTPKIENIYANKEKRTIVIKWQDNTSTKVTCNEKDTWDIEKGIAMAVAKKALGNNYNAYTILNKYIESVKYAQPTLQEKTPRKTR